MDAINGKSSTAVAAKVKLTNAERKAARVAKKAVADAAAVDPKAPNVQGKVIANDVQTAMPVFPGTKGLDAAPVDPKASNCLLYTSDAADE